MTKKIFSISIISMFFFGSCQSQTKTTEISDTSQTLQIETKQEPNFNYYIEIPETWTMRDTVLQGGLKVRFLLPPEILKADYPAANILVTIMNGQKINDFTTNNIDYLKANMQGIIILERGKMDSSMYNGQWYTYTKEQNGIVRDMINYIIPINGFAYMITCGTRKGSMNKYRASFDKIAQSFKG
jgi:hypothetical protein